MKLSKAAICLFLEELRVADLLFLTYKGLFAARLWWWLLLCDLNFLNSLCLLVVWDSIVEVIGFSIELITPP